MILLVNRMKRLIYKPFKALMLASVVLTALAMLCACQDIAPDETIPDSTDGLTITGSIVVPDMPQSESRGLLGDAPNQNLKLTILEFDKGADAEHSFLTNVYNADLKQTTDKEIVEFSFTLKAATTPKELHLFLASNYLKPEFGSIATLLPQLTVGVPGSEYEAYWGCQTFPDGFTDITESEGVPQLLDEVKTKLTRVPMIRNFAKITVTESESLNDFELLGFDIVNVPTSGTIAPWNQTESEVPTLNVGDQMKSYQEISQSYSGIVPGAAQFRNSELNAKSWTVENGQKDYNSKLLSPNHAEYMYEHPYESTRRSYLIVYGKYTDSNKQSTYGFYKLDIGMRNATTHDFEYYNIIRNIHYKVIITHVYAPGTATVAEAIARAPFNNLIGAVETSSMLNVSNGKNLIIVNDTNHIIVEKDQTVDILYRYIKDVTGTKTEDNGVPHVVGLHEGPVIKEVVNDNPEAYTDGNGVNWMKISLKINDPTSVVKTQSITIVDVEGLGRTINLVLRNPWRYARLKDSNGNESQYFATIAPNTSNLYTTPVPQNVSCNTGEPLTVFFDLPDGLPEAMFPLDFQLESQYQGIENDKVGNLVVVTGPSLFNPNFVAISYMKTVTYAEYRYQYADNSNEVDINKPNANHTVRCRFLTINTVTDGSEGKIRIHNPYFSPDVDVTFKRVTNP